MRWSLPTVEWTVRVVQWSVPRDQWNARAGAWSVPTIDWNGSAVHWSVLTGDWNVENIGGLAPAIDRHGAESTWKDANGSRSGATASCGRDKTSTGDSIFRCVASIGR